MGIRGSKAARSAQRAASAVTEGAPAAESQAVSAAEQTREQHLQQLLQQQQQQAEPLFSRDEQLVQSMQKVMGSLSERQVDVSGSAEALRKYGWRKKSREEREAELAGRLDTPALKALFEERLRAAAHGRDPPSAAELAQRYGARQEVLEKVLQHASVPLISEAEDGRLVGSWPHKR